MFRDGSAVDQLQVVVFHTFGIESVAGINCCERIFKS